MTTVYPFGQFVADSTAATDVLVFGQWFDGAEAETFDPANGFPWPTHTFYSHRIAGVPYQQQVSPLTVEAAPETITLDKWEPRLSSLLFQKKWSRPDFNYTTLPFLPTTLVPSDWFQPISIPSARPFRQQPPLQALATVETPLDWLQPLSTPYPKAVPQALMLEPILVHSEAAPGVPDPSDWLPPLSQPLNRSRTFPIDSGGYPPSFPILPEGEVTLDKWYTPIQQPIFRTPPLRQSQITVSLPESTFASVIVISSVDLSYTSPPNRLDYTTTTNDLDYTAPTSKLDYTADDF